MKCANEKVEVKSECVKIVKERGCEQVQLQLGREDGETPKVKRKLVARLSRVGLGKKERKCVRALVITQSIDGDGRFDCNQW